VNNGAGFEALAAVHLEREGLEVVQKNFRCRAGEIDLICRDGDCLVFVEVRYRSNPGFASPLESITRAKQKRILRTAQVYLQRCGNANRTRCRFDVVAIRPCGGSRGDEIQWLRHAFTA
jgi:putative endonuclease